MKKISLVFLGFTLVCIFWGCKQNELSDPTSTTARVLTTTQASTITQAETKPEGITFLPEDLNFDQNVYPAHRACYFSDFWEARELFPSDAIARWDDFWGRATPTEMCLVAMIKLYNVPKEKFEEAIQRQAEILLAEGRDLSTEDWELPNADIIYTFDNEVINAYYRRENPVVPESGTYQTYESYEEYKKAMD